MIESRRRQFRQVRKQNGENKMEKNIVKENNGGGLQIERYIDGEIDQVVWGLEFAPSGQGLEDLVGFGHDWDYTDVGGNTVGANLDGNTDDAVDQYGNIITADIAVDEYDETQIIAEWDGETVTSYPERMGRAGQGYFGIDR